MTTTPAHRPRRVSRLLAAAALAGLVVLTPATPAAAHNQLIETDPAPDAQLATSPDAVQLVFVEPLDPDYTTVIVNDSEQSSVDLGEQVIDGGTVTVSLPSPLPDGTYTVAYRVVSADGHPVQGAYQFSIGDGDVGPPPEPGEPAAASDQDGGGTAGLVAVAGAVVLVAAGAYLWWRRQRRAA